MPETATKVYRVNPMTLTDFIQYLRDHGIPCSPQSAKAMIEAGVFGNAAIVCDEGTRKNYVIIPKRLDVWFQENADEVRE